MTEFLFACATKACHSESDTVHKSGAAEMRIATTVGSTHPQPTTIVIDCNGTVEMSSYLFRC